MISVGMSTSCVFPLPLEEAFRLARVSGFDGVEIMVTNDTATQNAATLRSLSHSYGIPILSIHAPVLLATQLVWGTDPKRKLEKSTELARAVGARTVVVHPPFRWQSAYARSFERVVRDLAERYDVEVAVENMFSWIVRRTQIRAYSPSPYPTDLAVDSMTSTSLTPLSPVVMASSSRTRWDRGCATCISATGSAAPCSTST